MKQSWVLVHGTPHFYSYGNWQGFCMHIEFLALWYTLTTMESPLAAKGKLIDGELPISHVHQVHAWSSAHSIPNKPLAWCDKYVYMQQWRWSKSTKICNETETLVHPKTSVSVCSCWHWSSEASCYEAGGAIWGPSGEWHNPWNNCQFLTSIFSLKFSLWAAIY
jgi:hypothetical protein